jgi:periplasmic protein TonB
MNFSQQQTNPRQYLTGLGGVIFLHVLVVYALVSGLGEKAVDTVRIPVETRVIEEVKKVAATPEVLLASPPKMEALPPQIKPPEVKMATPIAKPAPLTAPEPTPQPVKTQTAAAKSAPSPAAADAASSPASAVATEPKTTGDMTANAPKLMSIGLACSKQVSPNTPLKAQREGISGSVKARATIRGGKVVAVEILSAQPRGVFESAVRTAMLEYECQSSEDEIKADQAFDFTFKAD